MPQPRGRAGAFRRFSEMVEMLQFAVSGTIAQWALSRRMSSAPTAVTEAEEVPETNATSLVRDVLVAQTVTTLARMFDPQRREGATFNRAFTLVEQTAVIDELYRQARAPHAEQPDIADRSERLVIDALARARSALRALEGGALIARLSNDYTEYRKLSMIHLDDKLFADYHYLEEIVEGAAGIVHNLKLALSEADYDPNLIARVWESIADAYWMRLSDGGQTGA